MFNLVIVLCFAFAVSLFLIYFIAAHDRKLVQKNLLPQSDEPKPEFTDFRAFTKACMDLCNGLKLEVTDIATPSSGEVALRAASSSPITKVEFLICGFLLPTTAVLDNQKIMAISDHVVSERISKAIVITTGLFDPQVKNRPELAPMEFVDGKKFSELLKKYSMSF